MVTSGRGEQPWGTGMTGVPRFSFLILAASIGCFVDRTAGQIVLREPIPRDHPTLAGAKMSLTFDGNVIFDFENFSISLGGTPRLAGQGNGSEGNPEGQLPNGDPFPTRVIVKGQSGHRWDGSNYFQSPLYDAGAFERADYGRRVVGDRDRRWPDLGVDDVAETARSHKDHLGEGNFRSRELPGSTAAPMPRWRPNYASATPAAGFADTYSPGPISAGSYIQPGFEVDDDLPKYGFDYAGSDGAAMGGFSSRSAATSTGFRAGSTLPRYLRFRRGARATSTADRAYSGSTAHREDVPFSFIPNSTGQSLDRRRQAVRFGATRAKTGSSLSDPVRARNWSAAPSWSPSGTRRTFGQRGSDSSYRPTDVGELYDAYDDLGEDLDDDWWLD